MIMDKRKLWDAPSYKRHFACPETRKHQNLLHTFRAISQLSWWNEQVQSRSKKQVNFSSSILLQPWGCCHWRWGCGFKDSFHSLLPNRSHTTPVQVWASRPQEGPAPLPRPRGDWSPVLSHGLCWLMHKGWRHPPGLAGVTLCPVLLPLLQAPSPGMQQFLPCLSYFPPSHLRPSKSSSQKEVSPFLSYIHLDLASWLAHSPGSFQKPLPCPSFHAMLAWTEAHPFGLLPSSPLPANLPPCHPPTPPLAYLPLLWTCIFRTQSPNYSRIMTWRKMCNHSIFLSPSLPSLPLPSQGRGRRCNLSCIGDSVSQTSYWRCPSRGRRARAGVPTLMASLSPLPPWKFIFFTIFICRPFACLLFLPLDCKLNEARDRVSFSQCWTPRSAYTAHSKHPINTCWMKWMSVCVWRGGVGGGVVGGRCVCSQAQTGFQLSPAPTVLCWDCTKTRERVCFYPYLAI